MWMWTHRALDSLSRHLLDIVWAVAAAVLIDTFRFDSFIRRLIRLIKNKLAERSVDLLRRRIVNLEQCRDSLKTYLASDKAHYLVTLRCLIAMLVFMGLRAFLVLFGRTPIFVRMSLTQQFDALAASLIGLAIFVGVHALKLASFDSQDKIKTRIESIDSDIAGCATHRVRCDEWDAASVPILQPIPRLFHHKSPVPRITDFQPAPRDKNH